MTGLLTIREITVSYGHLKEAHDFLAYAGTKQVEGVALFAGSITNNTFEIKKVIIPRQMGYILEQGLMYAVEGNELHKINVWLHENNMILIAQIHSHPRQAYHSETDDRFPIVDTIGGISMVVPNFAVGEINLFDWAIYRLSSEKTWNKLTSIDIQSLFNII